MQKLLIISAIAALSTQFIPMACAADANANDNAGKADARANVLIKASPRTVWKAIQIERQQDPEVAYSHVLSEDGGHKTIEQKFTNIPLLGSVIAVTRHTEEVNKHIEYTLVSSDKFKALDGAWDLTPVNGGRETMLSLRSHLDIGIPFSSFFIKGAAKKKLDHRVDSVKEIAEREQARIAHSGVE